MSADDDLSKRFAIANILPFCTDSEMTAYSIILMDRRKFSNASIQSFINLQESQKSNEEDCLRKILKGEAVKLPSQDPIIAMAEAQKRTMVQFSEPIQDVKIELVVSVETNIVKGYRFYLDDMPLEKWCATHSLPFEIFQAGLQTYAEVDLLRDENISIINDQLIEKDKYSGESKVLSYDEFIQKFNQQSKTWNVALEKSMKSDHFIQKNAKVEFLVKPFGKGKQKVKTKAVEETPKPSID